MSARPLARLLLVEDEDVLRGLVSQFLRLENYEVVAVEDGRRAVDVYAAEGPFDLVLLDLNLPILSGVEACRRIKLVNPAQPFLVCSAAILESHELALEELGVTEALGKPYHPGELLARLAKILAPRAVATDDDAPSDGKRRRGPAARDAPSPTPALSQTRSFD